MRKAVLPLLAPAVLLAACQITVPSPDLSAFQDLAGVPDDGPPGDPGNDPGPADVLPDEQPGDPGGDPGWDPGWDTAVDPGWDPGIVDTGSDLNETPGPVGSPCKTNQGCFSGLCLKEVCACVSATDCEFGTWCDGGDTAWTRTGHCLPARQLYAGCKHHVQCQSGACDQVLGYCAGCADGGTGCQDTLGCCFGNCAEFCLGCAIAPPPAPELTPCMSGCFEAATQFCGPSGPEGKRGLFEDCQFNNAWCQTNYCKTDDGFSSYCACRIDEDCGPGAFCIDGACAME